MGISSLMSKRAQNHTRISGRLQVTIPVALLLDAGLCPGDVLKVEAEGSGRVVMNAVDHLIDRYAGSIDSGGALQREVEGLRDEWP